MYIAIPQLLRAFGINASQLNSKADLLTSRPGLLGVSHMQLDWSTAASYSPAPGAPPHLGDESYLGRASTTPCKPAFGCLANPVIEEVPGLPSGTGAPNTVLTEHAVQTFALGASMTTAGWLIETAQPLTVAQVHNAQTAAASVGLSIGTKNDQPT